MKEYILGSMLPRMRLFARSETVRFYEMHNEAVEELRFVYTNVYEMFYLHDRLMESRVTSQKLDLASRPVEVSCDYIFDIYTASLLLMSKHVDIAKQAMTELANDSSIAERIPTNHPPYFASRVRYSLVICLFYRTTVLKTY